VRLPIRGRGADEVEIRAVYTIGGNYPETSGGDQPEPPRPLVYGKASTSLTGDGAVIAWDREVTANVDGECELGVVVAANGSPLGYTIVNDVTSQDAWLDGDQWLLGKSLPGFCPAGPSIVPADELDPTDLGLGSRVNGVVVQDGRTSQMRFSIESVLAYLGRHIDLREGDLIATGTPPRIGPDARRHLAAGDVMTCWVEGIGELTNRIG
jgi:2-keto-4-pentenoate hydratase/2-oxohepta-3-ene-1,7-dioic acid hydratase in catechol pathway